MLGIKHWQDAVNAVFGVWLVMSPLGVGYQQEGLAMWNAAIVGTLLVGAALGAILVPRAWEEWCEGALGLWLIASPWVLGFAGDGRLVAVLTGLLVTGLAAWTLATDEDYAAWWRDRVAH